MSWFKSLTAFLFVLVMGVFPAYSAEREKIMAFMQVTGFDESLKALRAVAHDAPAMIGISVDDFGRDWTILADDLFEPQQLLSDALDILEKTLDADDLNHAALFYSSELGQRLMQAENEVHSMDKAVTSEKGMALFSELERQNSHKKHIFLSMIEATGGLDHSLAVYGEVEVRFIMAASAAGVIDMPLSEAELREYISLNYANSKQMLQNLTLYDMAYTYRNFSEDEMQLYVDALLKPKMQRVYELMNGIQYTLLSDRYQKMAIRMADLHPIQRL